MKHEKQDYLNGYEHGSVPEHLSYRAEKGYIAGIDEREFKRDLILYFKI